MPYGKPEDLDAAIRSGKLARLYLFDGPEAWLKERAVQRIVKKLIPPEAADFNLDRLDGRDSPAAAIVNALQSLPWMNERRLVIVQAADELSTGDARLVGEVLAGVPESTCAVFLCEGKANIREEIPAQISSHGQLITFWPPFPNQMPAWVMSEAKARGKSIDMPAASALCEACADLQEISNELDKLVLFVGKKSSISMADVAAHGLPDEMGDFRNLEEAVMTRNVPEALKQGRLLAESGVRTEAIFPVIERSLRTLMLGHYYAKTKGWPVMEIMQSLRIRAKAQQASFQTGLRAYDGAALRLGFERLAQADYEVKTGGLPSEIALSLVLLDVMGKSKPPRSGFGHR